MEQKVFPPELVSAAVPQQAKGTKGKGTDYNGNNMN
jgi:hypothetical protein